MTDLPVVEVDVIVEDLRWADALDLGAIADGAIRATASHLAMPGPAEIALLAASDDRIGALNAAFRGKNSPTNVLSWPAQEHAPLRPGAVPDLPEATQEGPPLFLGDIALAFETCLNEAQAAKKPFRDHATHLIVHAMLHLLGYDHEIGEDADLMESTEVAILAELGIGSPYE